MTARERLAQTKHDSLAAMMEAYAEEAVQMAASDYRQKLDYSEASIERLETVLSALTPAAAADLEWLTMLWGSYFGEVLRRRYEAAWVMTEYPVRETTDAPLSVPAIEVSGSKLYPLMKVHRRLTIGAAEGLPGFYVLVKQRLAAPSAQG